MRTAIRSEIRKLTSTRTFPLLVLSTALAGALGAYITTQPVSEGRWVSIQEHPFLWTLVTLLGVLAYVIGARIVTDEVRYGTLASAALATPGRARIVAAKAIVAALAGAAGGLAAAVVIASIVIPWSASQPGVQALTMSDLAPMLARLVAALALFAVIGAGVGAAVRHQVATVVGGLMFFLIADQMLAGLFRDAGRFFPGEAAASMVGAPLEGLIGIGAGAALFAAYAAAATLAGSLALRRSDLA